MGHSRAELVYRLCVTTPVAVALCLSGIPGGGALAGQTPDTIPAARADTLPAFRTQEITVRVARSLEIIGRLPFAVSTADADALQAAERTVSLDEALRFVPGLFVQNRRNFSLGDRITMRGLGGRAQFGVRGVRVLADGIPLTLADGQSTITNLDLSSGGRVEVIRGPASALYGNASGGVISVRTQFPSAEPLLIEPLFLGGTHGFFQGRLKASGTSGGFSWLGNLSYLNTDGFREHSKAEVLRANVTLAAPVGGSGEIRGVLSFYDTPFSENPSSLTLEDATRRPRMARSFIISQGSGEDATQGNQI